MPPSLDPAFRIEFIVSGAGPVAVDIDIEEALHHAASAGSGAPAGDQREFALAGVLKAIEFRMSEGTGQFSITDTSDRDWIIPARSVLAVNVADVQGPRRRIGFNLAGRGPSRSAGNPGDIAGDLAADRHGQPDRVAD